MQVHCAERFTREMGCTETEWLRWLPAAIGERPWRLDARHAVVELPPGQLNLHWETLPPRVIALMRLPVLRVDFAFDGLDGAQRHAFMRRFDLYMQRGGG